MSDKHSDGQLIPVSRSRGRNERWSEKAAIFRPALLEELPAMCGIAGWLGTIPHAQSHAVRMAQLLYHRGPDASGIRAWKEAALVHTRLSIIDLSPAGAQPMSNEDGTVWVVFNGEIYNHRELRRGLETRGHVFRGYSDTEVLPHLYEEEGSAFLARLRGMFALAIYDTRSRALLLARDRFGIKPLFYSIQENRLAFSSEIAPLLTLPGIDDRPDRQAVYDFAALFYIPAPETFYRGIRALQPGEMLQAQWIDHRLDWRTRTYYRWSIAPDPDMTLTRAAEQADALLTSAVRRQMESDVPLGILLSGGIDSSLVSVAAHEADGNGLRTFNVRFPEKDYDETWAAVAVANCIRSDHVTLDMNDTQGTWDHVTDVLQHAGQPFADTSLFPVHSVCHLMRRHVTVALSGDGGDEAFGGYNFYWWLAWIDRWQRLPAPLLAGADVTLAAAARVGLVPDRLRPRLANLTRASDPSIIEDLFCWVRQDEHRRLCRDRHLLPVSRLFEPQWEHHLPPKAPRLEGLSMLATEANVRLTLANDFLFKVDTASMKESLEVRVPLLDEELFEFALSLPHRLKVKGRSGKRVLRAIARRKLPRAVARKPKWGFAVPVDRWVTDDFKDRLRQTLLGRSSRLDEFFQPETYRPLVEFFCDGRPHPGISRQGLYQRAIMLLSVQLALDRPIKGTNQPNRLSTSFTHSKPLRT